MNEIIQEMKGKKRQMEVVVNKGEEAVREAVVSLAEATVGSLETMVICELKEQIIRNEGADHTE